MPNAPPGRRPPNTPLECSKSEFRFANFLVSVADVKVVEHTVGMIRAAQIDDVPLLIQFIDELAEYERLSDSLTLSEDRLREHLFGERPCIEALVADAEGVPAGFALFYTSYSTFQCRPGIYLEDIFVRPAFRGRGIGRSLLLSVAKIAVDRDCGRMEWAVLNWNEPAIGFYQSLGAVPLDEWTRYRLTAGALNDAAQMIS